MLNITRKFSDLDVAFQANPVTYDLSVKKNENAVKSAIRNLVMTRNYERPFDSSIGSQMTRFLFEPMDTTTIILMKEMISRSITNHEPRVDLLEINIIPNEDRNEVVVDIKFLIKNTTRPLNVNIVLDRTR